MGLPEKFGVNSLWDFQKFGINIFKKIDYGTARKIWCKFIMGLPGSRRPPNQGSKPHDLTRLESLRVYRHVIRYGVVHQTRNH